MEDFKDILTTLFKPKLKAIGFRTSGNSFYRTEDNFTLKFDIWKSQWNTSIDMTFWFDIGVFRPDYYEFMFHKGLPNYIRTNHCSLRLGSGSVLRKGVPQYSYRLTPQNKRELTEEIENDLDNSVVPFLTRIKNIEDVLEFKDLDPVYCSDTNLFVGFVLAQTGNIDRAQKLIVEYLSFARYPTNWVDRILAECDRLKLKIKK